MLSVVQVSFFLTGSGLLSGLFRNPTRQLLLLLLLLLLPLLLLSLSFDYLVAVCWLPVSVIVLFHVPLEKTAAEGAELALPRLDTLYCLYCV